jgi:hypothetical protein
MPMRAEPTPVTLIVPYYESAEFFAHQLAVWSSYLQSLAQHLSIIVVDDGSPHPAVMPVTSLNLRLFRIEVDVPWNWLAARNIGAHHAADGWLLLTDMDHVVPEQTLLAVIYGARDPEVAYGFSRVEHTGEPIGPHSASFLLTRDLFWRIGGYDERLSGVYGTDGSYRKRLMRTTPVQILREVLVRYEYVSDASVTQYERKTPSMRAARRDRFAQVSSDQPRTLSFPYHECGVSGS